MGKMALAILGTGALGGAAIYYTIYGAIELKKYLKLRQCGYHICRFCSERNKCSWKNEWNEIKREI